MHIPSYLSNRFNGPDSAERRGLNRECRFFEPESSRVCTTHGFSPDPFLFSHEKKIIFAFSHSIVNPSIVNSPRNVPLAGGVEASRVNPNLVTHADSESLLVLLRETGQILARNRQTACSPFGAIRSSAGAVPDGMFAANAPAPRQNAQIAGLFGLAPRRPGK